MSKTNVKNSHQLRIMTMGDSITDHGNEFRKRLGGLLDEGRISYAFVGSRGQRIQHEGHSGFTTGDIAKSVISWIENSQPDIVMLMIGTNDVWRRMSLPDAAANVVEIVGKIKSASPQVHAMVAKILPMVPEPGNVLVFNKLLEEALTSHVLAGDVTLVDIFSAFDVDQDLKDGIHPNSSGYLKIAERWFESLPTVTRT